MPFGLSNAPAMFQCVMELTLQCLQGSTFPIYTYDVVVFGDSAPEHLVRCRAVLGRMELANLKLKPDKCNLLEKEGLFLGHLVSDGVRLCPTNVDRIIHWDAPKYTKQVWQFLGMATYYRRFIQDFVKIATPLSKLTSKNVKFIGIVTVKWLLIISPGLLLGQRLWHIH